MLAADRRGRRGGAPPCPAIWCAAAAKPNYPIVPDTPHAQILLPVPGRSRDKPRSYACGRSGSVPGGTVFNSGRRPWEQACSRSGAQRQQSQAARLCQALRIHRFCCRFPADRGQARSYKVGCEGDTRTKKARSASSSPSCSYTRQSRHHKSRLGCRPNADDAQWVERQGCRESAVRAWMPVRRGPTERRRSAGTRGTRAQPGAGHFWLLLVPFQK